MDFHLRNLIRNYQLDPLDQRNYLALVAELDRTGNQDEKLKVLQHQYQIAPDNEDNYHRLVKAFAGTPQLLTLGFRHDPEPLRRPKLREGPFKRILDSGVFEHFKIPYYIQILPADEYSYVVDAEAPQESGREGVHILLGRSKISNTDLLYTVAQQIVAGWTRRFPMAIASQITRPMPEDVGRSSASLIIVAILLHWYLKVSFTDHGGLESYLNAIENEGGYATSGNDVFVQTFVQLKKLGLLDYFGSATKRMESFIVDNYQNYSRIKLKLKKEVAEWLKQPIKKLQYSGDREINQVMAIKVRVRLKNGEQLEFSVQHRAYYLANLIMTIGYFHDYLALIEVVATRKQFSIITRQIPKDMSQNLRKLLVRTKE